MKSKMSKNKILKRLHYLEIENITLKAQVFVLQYSYKTLLMQPRAEQPGDIVQIQTGGIVKDNPPFIVKV